MKLLLLVWGSLSEFTTMGNKIWKMKAESAVFLTFIVFFSFIFFIFITFKTFRFYKVRFELLWKDLLEDIFIYLLKVRLHTYL